MGRMLRAVWDGLRLRCPRCHQGHMFARPFTMRRLCPDCALPFESAAGEITGGLCINATLTLCVLVVLAFLGGNDPAVPLIPLFGGLLLVAILFPIACYPASRGLWASVLYLTGANAEGDDAGTAVPPAGAMTHEAAQALIRQMKHGRRCMIANCTADMDVTTYLSWRPHGGWVQQTARTPRDGRTAATGWERRALSELEVERWLRAPGVQVTVR